MTSEGKNKLKTHEGLRLKKYRDQYGFWTIGYGHKMVKRILDCITLSQAEEIFENDIRNKEDSISAIFPWWEDLTPNRQDAIVEMAFQMGVDGLLHFPKALKHMEAGEYHEAAVDFRDSLWCKEQTPIRAEEVIERIENG